MFTKNEIDAYAEKFEKNNYVKLTNVLTDRESALICNLLHFAYMYQKNDGDPLVEGTHSAALPILDSLMLVVQPLVEAVTNKKLYPTYGYSRMYQPGARLRKHVDRASCEISVNLCVGYFYDTEDKTYRWNIVMDDEEVATEIGDFIIYKGLEVDHWRDEFVCGEKSWQAQVFLHYVDANGPYADFIWDGRENFGTYAGKRELPAGRTTWNAE